MPGLATRTGEGLALIAILGLPYLVAAQISRLWPSAGGAISRRVHRVGGPWFASYCRRHGALLLKLGQVVGSRPDILPLDYVDACAGLRDRAPARPFAVVRRALDRAYEGRIDEHLRDLDPQPLASASFGQVHRATLPDGTPVAVKVQHPDLAPRVAIDLALLRLALRLIRAAAPGWPVGLIAEEVERTSREEQDYLHEATAAERLRPLLERSGIAVPRVHFAHTRDTVLVMEFASGSTLAQTDLATLAPAQRRAIAERIVGAWLDMLLEEGFFHADPHGGNFILDGDRLWLIDFGMTATISPHDRILYARFLARLARDDIDGMVDALVDLGVLLPGADLADLRALAREIYGQLGTLNPRAFKGSRREAVLSAKVSAFLRRGRALAFPRHTILLSRALTLIEGVCGDLVPDKPMFDIARPRLSRLDSPWAMLRDTFNDTRERLSRLLDLPERLERLLTARQSTDWTPILAALALIAALLAPPGPWATAAALGAGLALILALLRPRG